MFSHSRATRSLGDRKRPFAYLTDLTDLSVSDCIRLMQGLVSSLTPIIYEEMEDGQSRIATRSN